MATYGELKSWKKKLKTETMRTETIKEILNISPKRKDINYYNYLVSLTDSELERELTTLKLSNRL